jgi:hypothetical protein
MTTTMTLLLCSLANPDHPARCICRAEECRYCRQQNDVVLEREIESCLLVYALLHGGWFWPPMEVGEA